MPRNHVALLAACWLALAAGPALAAEPDAAAEDEQALRLARLGTDGRSLLEFFRKRAATDASRARAADLVRRLGDDDFTAREKASAELVALGRAALPALKRAAADPDAEVARRAAECLRLIENDAGPALAAAAARLVARRKPEGAAEALLAYLPSADGEVASEEVRAALAAVAVRGGKAEAAVVQALADADSVRRAAAAEALCRAGAKDQGPAVRRLLADRDAGVRLQAALGLAGMQDRDAVAALIDLLAVLPPEQAWLAEEALGRLAGGAAPAVPLGTDAAGRKRCRDAWDAWWKKDGARADLARLTEGDRPLGYTLVVVQTDNGAGRVMEVDAGGRVRWQVGGLQYPLDAHVIGGDRVLIAEGGRVTERNFKGEVLWEKAAGSPFAAQRLPNGHTFIAANNTLTEVDRGGKEVVAHPLPRPESVMAVQKLRDGQIGYVTNDGTCVRLDASGKEVRRWPVGQVLTRGGLDLLPDGGAVVAQVYANKVVEYNRDGKAVWEAAVEHPTSVVRLRNGHTLVAAWNTGQVVELDRAGKAVWQYKVQGEMSRARRR
jgi:HEAT repeat protein